MIRSRLVLGVAAVLAGTAVLLVVLGFVYNPVLVVAAVPFALATFFLWSHATGRLLRRADAGAPRAQAEFGGRAGRRRPGGPNAGGPSGFGERRRAGDGRGPVRSDPETLSRRAAASVLDVAPDADHSTVRRAFRERARDLHPDAPDGDAEAFRRVRAAYDRLAEDR